MAAITLDGRQELVALYLTMFGRAPSVVQLAEMVVAREGGATLADVAADLSTETAFALIASLDAESFATYLADALLADDIPAAAREWAENWVVTNVSGTKSKAQVIAEAVQAIRATENTNYASSQTELSADVTAALDLIGGVDQVTDTFTLTTGADYADNTSSYRNGGLLSSTFTFTTGNEVINAGAGTLTGDGGGAKADDAIVDLSTTDADVLNATLITGAVEQPIIQNIETLNLTATIANSGLDFANILGAKNVNINGAANVTLNNVSATSGPAIALNGYSKVATVQAASLVGLADALNVTLSGAAVSGFNVPGLALDAATAGTLESLTIDSAGETKNTLSVTGTANVQGVTKTTVTGAADLDLRIAHLLINGQTLDGSAHTGELGLSIDRDGALTATTNLTNVTGVDSYTFRDSTAGGDALVASGLANGSTVTVAYAAAGAGSLAVKGAASSTTNSLTVALDHATAATDITLAGLTINDVETVNIVSEGGTTTGNVITDLAVAASSKVTVDGSTKLSLELAGTSTVSSVTVSGSGNHAISADATLAAYNLRHLTIDGSAATGKLTLDGSEFVGTAGSTVETLTVLGGSNDDTITATADANAKNVIDAGAGADTVSVTTLNASNVTLGAGQDKVTITDLTGTAAVTFTDFATGSTGDQLILNTAAAMTVAAGATGVANQLVVINTTVANDAAAQALLDTAGAEGAVLVINDATGIAELWYDTNGAGTDGVKLASFENITTVGALTSVVNGFAAANFAVV